MQTRKTELILVSILFLVGVFIPCRMLAQGTNPLPCCDKEPPPGPNSLVSTGDPNLFTISDSTLLALGMTRSQFLNSLAASLFPDQQVSLIIPVTETFIVPTDPSVTGSSASFVTVSYQVLIPLSEMKPEWIDVLDQFVMTNGVIQIPIKFTQIISAITL